MRKCANILSYCIWGGDSNIWLCNRSFLDFLIYEEKCFLLFYQCYLLITIYTEDSAGTTTFLPWPHARKGDSFLHVCKYSLLMFFHLCWESWTLCVRRVFPTAGWGSSHPRRARPAQKNRKGTVAWDGFFTISPENDFFQFCTDI